MFHTSKWHSKQKGFGFKTVNKSITSTTVYMELSPNNDKLPEIVKGSVILTLLEGQCLLMLGESTLQLPMGPVRLENKSNYALKNISSKKCYLLVDFIQ